MVKWLTLQQFQSITPYQASPYIALTKLTKDEQSAAFQKFMSDFQSEIDRVWATGSCSKSAAYEMGQNICPFGK